MDAETEMTDRNVAAALAGGASRHEAEYHAVMSHSFEDLPLHRDKNTKGDRD